ncbi:uncharacterized protein LOC120743239 [Simochromis diagramma]|uniref:uncharacterized protein LOC120743239 n=1 Tax=Simochromis diagramma TaxID=43689 RepID=UPI001A7E8309|nr:uncharacterized protein LOC120743239 [Simochromis diagramma]
MDGAGQLLYSWDRPWASSYLGQSTGWPRCFDRLSLPGTVSLPSARQGSVVAWLPQLVAPPSLLGRLPHIVGFCHSDSQLLCSSGLVGCVALVFYRCLPAYMPVAPLCGSILWPSVACSVWCVARSAQFTRAAGLLLLLEWGGFSALTAASAAAAAAAAPANAATAAAAGCVPLEYCPGFVGLRASWTSLCLLLSRRVSVLQPSVACSVWRVARSAWFTRPAGLLSLLKWGGFSALTAASGAAAAAVTAAAATAAAAGFVPLAYCPRFAGYTPAGPRCV